MSYLWFPDRDSPSVVILQNDASGPGLAMLAAARIWLRPFSSHEHQTIDVLVRKIEKPLYNDNSFSMVPGQGFEPRFSVPETDVLPLDDPGSSFGGKICDLSARNCSPHSPYPAST